MVASKPERRWRALDPRIVEAQAGTPRKNRVKEVGDEHPANSLDAESIVEHVAGVEDYQIALATYRAACERWPGTPITLRQGARVIEDSRRLRVV